MGPLGIWEIVAIAVVALIVLGPRRLPEAARQLGKWIRQFKDHSASVKSELADAIDPDDLREITAMQRDLKDAMSFKDVMGVGSIEGLTTPAQAELSGGRANGDGNGAGDTEVKRAEAITEDDKPTRRLPGATRAVEGNDAADTARGTNSAAGGDSDDGDEPRVTRRLPT